MPQSQAKGLAGSVLLHQNKDDICVSQQISMAITKCLKDTFSLQPWVRAIGFTCRVGSKQKFFLLSSLDMLANCSYIYCPMVQYLIELLPC